MGRFSWWRAAAPAAVIPLAALALVGALAARSLWLAWQYFFDAAPRYRVESALIALAVAGAIAVVFRRGPIPGPIPGTNPDPIPGPIPGPNPDPIPGPNPGWLLVMLAGAVVLYLPAIGLGFLSDDFTLRAMAQADALGTGIGWFFRPLPLLLWRGLLAFGDAPALLHLLNVLLHGVNAYLVASLGSAMGMRREHALAGAAIFLAFPALPEAVAWTSGIQDVLMTTMALAAVVVAGREPLSGRRIAIVCVLLILGLASKETAICIPALVALCWLTPSRVRRDAMLYGALALVTIIYLAIRLPMGIASEYLAAPSRYFFKQVIVTAFGTLAVPWRVPTSGLERTLAFGAGAAIVVLLVYACLSWRREDRRMHRDVRLGLWVLVSVGPVFTLFFVSPMLEGARYLYLATAAWALVIADLIALATDRMSQRRRVFGVASALVVLVFVVSLQRELGVWRRAADLRDRVLTDARTTIAGAGCGRVTVNGVPDSVEGAYVFRNGFAEAAGLAAEDSTSSAAECRFTWTDSGFRRLP